MHSQGILKSDEMICRFFSLATEMCVDLTCHLLPNVQNESMTQMTRSNSCNTLDAFVKLTALLIKYSGEGATSDDDKKRTKVELLNRVLRVGGMSWASRLSLALGN